jgi:hypothetical protein
MGALEMLKAERDKLNRAIDILEGGGGNGNGVPSPFRAAKKRIMSAEARAKIAIAQKARWAKAKIKSAEKSVKKFTMSPAARAAIAKAKKTWWAKKKAS